MDSSRGAKTMLADFWVRRKILQISETQEKYRAGHDLPGLVPRALGGKVGNCETQRSTKFDSICHDYAIKIGSTQFISGALIMNGQHSFLVIIRSLLGQVIIQLATLPRF